MDDDDDYSEFDEIGPDSDLSEPAELPERVGWRYTLHSCDPAEKMVMFGEYEGIARLGAGSFGHVFRARDPKLDRLVAIKVCKLADEEHRDMFLREAQLTARLSHHPNIVTIHELGRFESDVDGDAFDGAPFMVMELAADLPNEYPPVRTAKQLLRKQLCWADALDFYRAAGRGLAAAHAEGIVHGDFKPSNVLLGKRGAMVSDFGLAHTLGSADGHAGGTEGYRAPELYGSGSNSPQADQFAFCVALWEMIVGCLPVDETMTPRPCPPGVMPSRLILALLRGMSVDPGERWPSMDDLLEELGQIRATSKLPKPRRPRPPGGVLAYTIFGGLIGAMVVALLMERPQLRAELREDSRTGLSAERALKAGPEQQSEGALAQESVEKTGSDEEAENNKGGCVVSPELSHTPSRELEEVCKLIRLGKLVEAGEKWKRVRAKRSPEESDEAYHAKLMNIATETSIVVDTCDNYALELRAQREASVEDTRLEDVRDLSVRMAANCQRDKELLGASLLQQGPNGDSR